ncbi:hypothetical protein BC826DRAFT_63749 [Russula brevipes]|nr:hypothetical protein BC826DRAFT_63749 [Russula brevipes]
MRVILASNRGTLMELGINFSLKEGPILGSQKTLCTSDLPRPSYCICPHWSLRPASRPRSGSLPFTHYTTSYLIVPHTRTHHMYKLSHAVGYLSLNTRHATWPLADSCSLCRAIPPSSWIPTVRLLSSLSMVRVACREPALDGRRSASCNHGARVQQPLPISRTCWEEEEDTRIQFFHNQIPHPNRRRVTNTRRYLHHG